jgi:hypothetical protein
VAIWRRKFDPYGPIDMPEFGVVLLADPQGLRAAMKGDTSWVVDTDHAVALADAAAARPTTEAIELADRSLATNPGRPTDAARRRTAEEVQWGMAFARADPHRLHERPPVAHTLFVQRIAGRTAFAEGTVGRFLATACRLGFIYGRGGPEVVNLPPARYHVAWHGPLGATFTVRRVTVGQPQITWRYDEGINDNNLHTREDVELALGDLHDV